MDVWNSLGELKDDIKPKIIIVEFNTQGNEDYRCREQLLKDGYILLHTNEANDIFSHPEFYDTIL